MLSPRYQRQIGHAEFWRGARERGACSAKSCFKKKKGGGLGLKALVSRAGAPHLRPCGGDWHSKFKTVCAALAIFMFVRNGWGLSKYPRRPTDALCADLTLYRLSL